MNHQPDTAAPKLELLTCQQADEAIAALDPEYRKQCVCRFGQGQSIEYLQPLSSYADAGDHLLSRLRFDPSPAGLRLWAFVFSETKRLFAARQAGQKIFAVMKDLGTMPVLTYALPQTTTFYADEFWWSPCLTEDTRLLDAAEALGCHDQCCYVRAALGAYELHSHFPEPDLSIAAVGSCCDDFSAIMQLIAARGHKTVFWDLPLRKDPAAHIRHQEFSRNSAGQSWYQHSALDFLVQQFRRVKLSVEQVAEQPITDEMLLRSISFANRVRELVREIRDLAYGTVPTPLAGLETMLCEFLAIHYCSDPLQCLAVLEDLLEEVRRRVKLNQGVLPHQAFRTVWAMPCTDPSILQLWEQLGGCVAGTEYLISHSRYGIRTDCAPLSALAEAALNDPCIGSTAFRAQRVLEQLRKYKAEAVIIPSIFGASHCSYEIREIASAVQSECGLPVLSFEVPFSTKEVSKQVANRLGAFAELLQQRRTETTKPQIPSVSEDN